MKKINKFLIKNKNTFEVIVWSWFFSFNLSLVSQVNWTNDGDSYYKLENNQLLTYTLPNHDAKTVITKAQLTPDGRSEPLKIDHFSFSLDQQKVLLFTKTKKVWRLKTKGDYWVFNFKTNTLRQIGTSLKP
ncbi:MAG: hypothetical protein QNK88_08675, partial [Polaribacter sp.]